VLRRRSAVEPVIGRLKSENRKSRNHLAHTSGDAINAIIAPTATFPHGWRFLPPILWVAADAEIASRNQIAAA
jgi:IS5 family transposase